MLHPLDRFEWERMIRRVDMHPTAKLIALMLAGYANRHGANAHPGNQRLALDCGVKVRTVERHMEWLRTHGLIERTFRGSSAGRSKMADTYQLVVADDLPTRGVTFNRSADTDDGCSEDSTPVTPDTGDGSSAVSPDVHDGCSPVDNTGTPDTDDGSSESEHPTSGEEHPTSATGTPDIWTRTPDTGVAPSSSYIKQDQQEEHHHAEASASARTHASDDLTDQPANSTDKDQIEIELEAIKRLPPAALEELLNEAHSAVGTQGWPAVVHYAHEHMPEGAVA